jgi:hypothetical protein
LNVFTSNQSVCIEFGIFRLLRVEAVYGLLNIF